MRKWLFLLVVCGIFCHLGKSQRWPNRAPIPSSSKPTPHPRRSNTRPSDSLEKIIPLPERLTQFFNFDSKELKKPQIEQFDGAFNDHDWILRGAKGGGLVSLVLPESSSNSRDLPNPFLISESLLRSEESHFSISGLNSLFVHFGLSVLNEILDSQHEQCPASLTVVPFPEKFYDSAGNARSYYPSANHSHMILNKAQEYRVHGLNSPARKLNARSSWLDGEIIYGNSKFCSDRIRTFKNGKLIDLKHLDLRQIDYLHCFDRFGSNSVYHNPFTASILVVWMRWHNTIANVLSLNHRHLSDEQVFFEARKLTIASLQHVVYEEWLPVMLKGDGLEPYAGYKSTTNPQVSNLFDAVVPLYHFSLLSSCVFKLNTDCARHLPVRLCNSYGDTFHPLINSGHEQILNGLLLQSAQSNDHRIIEDVQKFARGPFDFSRKDQVAILLQQSRDYAVPDYLTVLRSLGFDNATYDSIEDLASNRWSHAVSNDAALVDKINKIYVDDDAVNNIDFAVGALLEGTGDGPGEIVAHIVREQFTRIREADRFHYENVLGGHFTKQQIEHIRKFRFVDILRVVSNVNEAFFHSGSSAFLLPVDREEVTKGGCRHLRSILADYPCRISVNKHSSARQNCLSIDPKRSKTPVEPCTKGQTFDYFRGSEKSFTITFVFVALFIVFLLILRECLIRSKNSVHEKVRIRASKMRRMTVNNDNTTICREWVNETELYRPVEIIFEQEKRMLRVQLEGTRQTQRYIFLRKNSIGKVLVQTSQNKNQDHVLMRIPNEYDLVLAFDTYFDRERFSANLESFLVDLNIDHERVAVDLKYLLRNAYTKEKRQAHLEQFFRVIFSHTFGKSLNQEVDVKTAKEIINTELTQFEFAEALSMTPTSTFVQQMFSLIDKDNNGYISFREFLDVMVIFAKGTPEQKIRIMFDMYDCNQNGRLSLNDFRSMIKSLLEIANQDISPIEMDQTIHSMLNEVGMASKRDLSFEDFNKLFNNYKEELGYSELNFDLSNISKTANSKRQSTLLRANDTIIRAYSYFGGKSGPDFSKPKPSYLEIKTQDQVTRERDTSYAWVRFFEARTKEIFFIVLYTAIMFAIFFDKCYYYTFLNEQSGLRQIAGYGVTLTRGSASVIMFTFSTILVTMCRNLITFLRETFLHRFIPFDSAVVMHKYIAFWAFIMTIVHVVGHAMNFYHISTQRPSTLNCAFKEMYFIDNQLPKFHHWAFGTITGVTGILLLCLLFVIYIFALQYSRRHVFNAFWATHNLFPIFYILIILHGLGKLIQPPIFYFYFSVPITLFIIDRLISVSRKKVEISVIRAVLHPSNVTHLEFKKPPNFDYKSGQWMRIACVELNTNEYHPFTIASAPHEETLSMYIRAVGPFTKNLRKTYDSMNLNGRPYPKLYLDGPYGEGHQDWLKFEVSVLVGGGIGITPFASIIKDIAYRSENKSKIVCKKVYFLWITRTQKQFEWMSDMIREAEEKDQNNLLQTHIFITQFYEKYDLRTTMLYICERHFQRISNKSLFTGLRAKTHFGRPNFEIFFDSLQLEHPSVERVGVFSCGPGPMTSGVQAACETLNRKDGAMFIHHFENF